MQSIIEPYAVIDLRNGADGLVVEHINARNGWVEWYDADRRGPAKTEPLEHLLRVADLVGGGAPC